MLADARRQLCMSVALMQRQAGTPGQGVHPAIHRRRQLAEYMWRRGLFI